MIRLLFIRLFVLALVATPFALLACPPPTPPNPPGPDADSDIVIVTTDAVPTPAPADALPTPVDARPSTPDAPAPQADICTQACTNLLRLGCKVGRDVGCVGACRHAADASLAILNPACLAAAKTDSDVAACGTTRCLDAGP